MRALADYLLFQLALAFSPAIMPEFYIELEELETEQDLAFLNEHCEIADGLAKLYRELYPARGFSPVTYAALMANAIISAPQTNWDFWDYLIQNGGPLPQTYPLYDDMVDGAFRFYKEKMQQTANYREPSELETQSLLGLIEAVKALYADRDNFTDDQFMNEKDGAVRTMTYDVAKKFYGQDRDAVGKFFKSFYAIVLGHDSGPPLFRFIDSLGPTRFETFVTNSLNRAMEE